MRKFSKAAAKPPKNVDCLDEVLTNPALLGRDLAKAAATLTDNIFLGS